MKNYFFCIVILFFIFFSCNEKKNEVLESVNTTQIFTEKFYDKRLRDSLADKAIYSNDTLAYKELRKIYYLSNNVNEFYYYALLMNNRNDFKSSAKDIYFILNKNIKDKKTEKIAKEYFEISKK